MSKNNYHLSKDGRDENGKEFELGARRPSQMCPKCCDRDDCYDEFGQTFVEGEEYRVWFGKCKTLTGIEKEASKKI